MHPAENRLLPVRREQLRRLLESLAELVAILRRDPRCRWTAHFEGALEEGRRLEAACTQDALNAYSGTVTYVYGGAGSFGDYTPGRCNPATGCWEPIGGMENLDVVSRRVYEQAIELRVVGER